MSEELQFNLYDGNGITISGRKLFLPKHQALSTEIEHPKNYVADKGLASAVNVALALGQPLLITGEPGTGKTQLASSIAYELELPLLRFNCKTTSTATDLFYHYDALKRFQDIQILTKQLPISDNSEIEVNRYISYQALGNAILLSKADSEIKSLLSTDLQKLARPTRSVILIDEIDKAPRDLPNDVLNELEKMEFKVKETEREFKADPYYRPILIFTSNLERNLPDPFLRRCIFYHIQFPETEQLKDIIHRRLSKYPEFTSDYIDKLVQYFERIRELPSLRKKPATAEFLAWARVLQSLHIVDPNNLRQGEAELLAISFSILAKTQEDLATLRKQLLG